MISRKPRLKPKPGWAKPKLTRRAWPEISSSPSPLEPGQSRDFQAKPERENHYVKGSGAQLDRRESAGCRDHTSYELKRL